MKITIIMFVKRVERVYCGGMRLLVHRPTYAIMTVYDPQSEQFGDVLVVQLKNNKFPKEFTKLFKGSNTVVAWNEIDYTILKALLCEQDIKDGTINTWKLKTDLKANGVPCSSLNAAAAEFGLPHCPRDGVISLPKALGRFEIFKLVVKMLIMRMQSDMFDFILV